MNLTPMIDIVFLLIIFFMVGTKFSEMEREYDVKLPTVSQAQPLTGRPDDLVINVRQSGVIQVNGQELSLSELEQDLRAAGENYPDQAVLIRGDGEGRYQHIMNVLAVCNRAEIKAVSLANRLQREGE